MNTKVVVVSGGIITILILVIVVIFIAFPPDPIPSPTSFGEWGQEIIVEFNDGSTESLNQILRFPLAVRHSGKPVSTITYKLSGRTRNEGQKDVEIDISAFYIDVLTKNSGGTVNTVKIESSGDISLLGDGQWHTIWQSTEKCDVNLFFPYSLTDGEYDINWMPSGIIKSSTDGIKWISEDLPGNILLKNVELTVEHHVTVTLNSSVETE